MTTGRPLLLVCAGLAFLFLLLGFLPWSKRGTPWRPAAPQEEIKARGHWEQGLIDRGRDFRSAGYGRYFLRKGVVGLALVLALWLGLNRILKGVPFGGGVVGATLALVAVAVILDLIGIPFGLAGLKSAREFGLSRQSLGFWMVDHVKGLGVSMVITTVVGLVLLFLMSRLPRFWPLPATLLAGLGGVLMALIVPLVVDPLFNTFTPLGNAGLRDRFLDLARRAGVPAREVLVSDASRRTTAVNAYFTGFGPTRRIVVYDTLVESLTPEEAGLVLAHEAGHWALGHIALGLFLGTLGLGLALLLARLVLAPAFVHGWFGIRGPLDPAAAPLLFLLLWLGTFASLPIENAVSRRMESRADRFALELTSDAGTQVAVEVALSRKNLADVVPPPLIVMLFYTHPPALDRIAQAEARAAPRPGPGADRGGP